ncbi:hypothetical protein RJ639_041840 [Escallonia herrerae]|uniref:UBC core domain-containing protein n=1 Tax=Escallonia herrerae TaxID=1293975 RepID=A0AA88WJX0_9ASTE|nr:hypothetical protein RJ639_041840 [Escallonia herrerae]
MCLRGNSKNDVQETHLHFDIGDIQDQQAGVRMGICDLGDEITWNVSRVMLQALQAKLFSYYFKATEDGGVERTGSAQSSRTVGSFGKMAISPSLKIDLTCAAKASQKHSLSDSLCCVDILYDSWSPAMTVSSICISILSMLSSSTAKQRPEDNDRYVKNCRNGRSPKETRWWFHDDKV